MISSSSSNWLDRLRSSRGFPTGEEPDLDRFISSSSSGSVESAAAATQSKSATRREKNITPKWTPPPGEFAGVLCDLFNMGGAKEEEGSRNFAKKKSSRKQPNPRFFCADLLPSSSSENNLNNNNNNNNNNNSDNNNGNENEYGGNVRVEDELNLRGVEDEEDVDLKGYTRSEVTVIDTSFEEWKSDKWVFRKNDEWRIKDKKKSKGKSRVFSGEKKKKKLSDDNNNNNNLGNRKLDDNDVGDNQLMKKKIEDLSSLHPNKGRPRAVKEREPFREREQFVGKVPRKRFPCPRPPEKTKNNECSPVVLIKSIPLNDTDTVAKISKTPQKKRPKQIKIV